MIAQLMRFGAPGNRSRKAWGLPDDRAVGVYRGFLLIVRLWFGVLWLLMCLLLAAVNVILLRTGSLIIPLAISLLFAGLVGTAGLFMGLRNGWLMWRNACGWVVGLSAIGWIMLLVI